MIFGFSPSRDLIGARLFSTIMYGVVMLVLLGVVGWGKEVRFDSETGKIETVYRVFGFEIRRDAVTPFYAVRAVVVQKVQLLQDRDIPMKKSGTLGGLIEARAQLFRLFIDYGDEKLKLDESNYGEQLTAHAEMIANFIDAELRIEEI